MQVCIERGECLQQYVIFICKFFECQLKNENIRQYE